eukprot:4175993-Alexandrium_andersonii.AAC.1
MPRKPGRLPGSPVSAAVWPRARGFLRHCIVGRCAKDMFCGAFVALGQDIRWSPLRATGGAVMDGNSAWW